MKRKNIECKKITIELPISTYNDLKRYCKDIPYSKCFYKDVINLAIIGYLQNSY